VCALLAVFAQDSLSRPEFEVASVRPAAPDPPGEALPGIFRGGPGTSDPGTFTVRFVLLRDLLRRAYGLRTFQVVGPAWVNNTHYDLNAKVPPGATAEQLNAMLQNLLAERFQLQLHHENRTHSAYELVVSKGGFKLKPSVVQPVIPEQNKPILALTGSKSFWGIVPRRGGILIVGSAMPVSGFAGALESQLDDVPVVDKTGLTGSYDFQVEFANDRADGSSLPSLFTAVEEVCGLKLQPTKASFETLVIDHIEPPGQN